MIITSMAVARRTEVTRESMRENCSKTGDKFVIRGIILDPEVLTGTLRRQHGWETEAEWGCHGDPKRSEGPEIAEDPKNNVGPENGAGPKIGTGPGGPESWNLHRWAAETEPRCEEPESRQ